MNPTEYNDPLQNGNQSSGEQQSTSQNEDNTQVTQSDTPLSTHPNEEPPPYPVQAGLNAAPLPAYSPATDGEPPPYPAHPVFYPGPPAPPEYYNQGAARSRYYSEGEESAFISFSHGTRHSPIPRQQNRSRVWRTLLKSIFVATSALLLFDSVFAGFIAAQLAGDVRNGTYNKNTQCNGTTGIYDPCHLHGAPSPSFSAASTGNESFAIALAALKLIFFPILMCLTIILLFYPNMGRDLIDFASGAPILAPPTTELETVETNTNANAQQEPGELENASQSRSRGGN